MEARCSTVLAGKPTRINLNTSNLILRTFARYSSTIQIFSYFCYLQIMSYLCQKCKKLGAHRLRFRNKARDKLPKFLQPLVEFPSFASEIGSVNNCSQTMENTCQQAINMRVRSCQRSCDLLSLLGDCGHLRNI